MIGKRKRLLSFIKDKNVKRYQELVKKIGIRGWFQLMKKKQSKKKTLNKRKKSSSEKIAFSKLESTSNPTSNTVSTTKKRSSSGIPKYVADRMARRIFFTAGIPTILGMSVFVVSYIIVTRNIAECFCLLSRLVIFSFYQSFLIILASRQNHECFLGDGHLI